MQALLKVRNINEYFNIYQEFLAHYPNGKPKVNAGPYTDVINMALNMIINFLNNHPTQAYLNAISCNEEKITETPSSDPSGISY